MGVSLPKREQLRTAQKQCTWLWEPTIKWHLLKKIMTSVEMFNNIFWLTSPRVPGEWQIQTGFSIQLPLCHIWGEGTVPTSPGSSQCPSHQPWLPEPLLHKLWESKKWQNWKKKITFSPTQLKQKQNTTALWWFPVLFRQNSCPRSPPAPQKQRELRRWVAGAVRSRRGRFAGG